MNEKNINMESAAFRFLINDHKWRLELAKSQTHVRDIRQLALICEERNMFVPAAVEEGEDTLLFSFNVDENMNQWKDVRNLNRNDQLRLLCNLAQLRTFLDTRITFFLHPDNLVFNDNLIPFLVYRGIRNVLPPYEINEEKFLLQYKCFAIALFSKKYTFDELYRGTLINAKDSEFERQVNDINDLDSLIEYFKDQYQKEKLEAEKTLQVIPKKRFRLFKRLSLSMIAAAIVLAIPLIYFSFIKIPFQQHLLEAHRDFLSTDYAKVITDLDGIKPEKLPDSGKYILAYSYVKSEDLQDGEKNVIMNNISLKSDPNYLLYWVYNGRGDFTKSLDLAMYIDDPILIMYSYIKKIEKAKNNPDLTGAEREDEIQKNMDKLKKYGDQYDLKSLFTSGSNNPASGTGETAAPAMDPVQPKVDRTAEQSQPKEESPRKNGSEKNQQTDAKKNP